MQNAAFPRFVSTCPTADTYNDIWQVNLATDSNFNGIKAAMKQYFDQRHSCIAAFASPSPPILQPSVSPPSPCPPSPHVPPFVPPVVPPQVPPTPPFPWFPPPRGSPPPPLHLHQATHPAPAAPFSSPPLASPASPELPQVYTISQAQSADLHAATGASEFTVASGQLSYNYLSTASPMELAAFGFASIALGAALQACYLRLKHQRLSVDRGIAPGEQTVELPDSIPRNVPSRAAQRGRYAQFDPGSMDQATTEQDNGKLTPLVFPHVRLGQTTFDCRRLLHRCNTMQSMR